jgi:hypothetical protein
LGCGLLIGYDMISLYIYLLFGFNLHLNWKVILGAVSKSFFGHCITFLSHLLAFCALNLPKISAELPPREYHVLNGDLHLADFSEGCKGPPFQSAAKICYELAL